MPSQMNFQALNFGNISQQEAEARRRYYESLANGFRSVGEGAKDVASAYDAENQRKQREAEDKKKWDNMIAQQEYQKEQDRINREYQATRDNIADTRYDNEYGLKLEDRRLEAEKRMNEHAALEDYQKGFRESFTPEILSKYGPRAQSLYNATVNAKSYAEAVARGGEFINFTNQQDMMDFQREQNAANEKRDSWIREADELVTSVDDRAARNNIDLSRNAVLPKDRAGLESLRAELEGLRDYLNTAQRHSVNSAARVAAINAKIKEIDRRLGPKPKRRWE